jgi:hypothetical protein
LYSHLYAPYFYIKLCEIGCRSLRSILLSAISLTPIPDPSPVDR